MLQSITIPSPTAGQLAEDRALGWGVVSGITSWRQWHSLGPVPGERMMHSAHLGAACDHAAPFGSTIDIRLTLLGRGRAQNSTLSDLHLQNPRIPESPQQGASLARHTRPPAAGCAADQRWVALLSPPSSAAIPHTAHRHSRLHRMAPHTVPPSSHTPQPCGAACTPNPCISSYYWLGR